jgi:hypothetical protein
VPPNALTRAMTRLPRRVAAAVAVLLVLAVAFGIYRASAASERGRPDATVALDADVAAMFDRAASLCTGLSGPRLAGQVTADAGDPTAATPAGLTALAGRMCDLIGAVGPAGGDPWEAALAAHRTGTDAVRAAGGVPSAARSYVDTVRGHAGRYAAQAAFRDDPDAPVGEPTPVPEQYLPLVRSAATACPLLSPARVAAQVMAGSGFVAGRRGPDVALGIAALRPEVWAARARSADSPFDPGVAVPALATLTCALAAELAPLGGDPYPLALAALRWDAEAVRRAGGVPQVPTVRNRVRLVLAYADRYATDPRVTGAPGPAPSTLAESPRPSRSTGPSASPAAKPSPGANPPAGYEIVGYGGRCIDVPGKTAEDGERLQVRDCTGAPNQRWTFDSDGTVRALGLCMDLARAATADGTAVQVANCNGGDAQRFTLNAAGDLVGARAGKCVDVRDRGGDGALLQIWRCEGQENQKWRRR